MADSSLFRRRVLVVSFEGWNDAGDAASTAVATLQEHIESTPLLVMDSETFYDYQYSRPVATFNGDGAREIQWPTTTFYGPLVPAGNSEESVPSGASTRNAGTSWSTGPSGLGALFALGCSGGRV